MCEKVPFTHELWNIIAFIHVLRVVQIGVMVLSIVLWFYLHVWITMEYFMTLTQLISIRKIIFMKDLKRQIFKLRKTKYVLRTKPPDRTILNWKQPQKLHLLITNLFWSSFF